MSWCERPTGGAAWRQTRSKLAPGDADAAFSHPPLSWQRRPSGILSVACPLSTLFPEFLCQSGPTPTGLISAFRPATNWLDAPALAPVHVLQGLVNGWKESLASDCMLPGRRNVLEWPLPLGTPSQSLVSSDGCGDSQSGRWK
jgi:hypothetical protein